MLKCQFHAHASGDLLDDIPYSPKELITYASKLNFEVLSITCHKKVIFNNHLKKFAGKKNLLLIPGIELEINNKHILAINISREIENVKTFDQLKFYKKNNPDCLIVAPHPFFPGKISLKSELIKNIDTFDAIENSFCYTKTKNYNKKAVKTAKKFGKPIIATSDCHILSFLDLGYTKVNSKKNTKSVINAIKKNNFEIHTSPTTYSNIFKFLSYIELRNIFRPKK